MTDRKRLYIVSILGLAALLVAFLVPSGVSGRFIAAGLLLPLGAAAFFLLKKRKTLSVNRNQVLLIIILIALLYVMAFYTSGLFFGFHKNSERLDAVTLFAEVLPLLLVIVFTEVFRFVLLSYGDKRVNVICYAACVMAEVLSVNSITAITSFSRFMDLVGMTLLPALTANFLYNYLSSRYGALPNIIYRAITTLHIYLIGIVPNTEDSLIAFFKLLLPIGIYYFIDMLYEKKRKYALKRKSKLGAALGIIAFVLMTGVVMLISNHFKYGTLVIASESMTGEINKGDALVFEQYDGQTVKEDDVLVFNKDYIVYVHRVVEIERINGVNRYYTKGDANESRDSGYITDADIIGIGKMKVPYVGYPTLWLRNIFIEGKELG